MCFGFVLFFFTVAVAVRPVAFRIFPGEDEDERQGHFPSRRLEQATYDSIAYRYICANNHPNHDSINSFRKRFLEQLEGLFEQILVMAHAMGVLRMGMVSLDGTKIKANTSRRKNLNWKQIRKVDKHIRREIKEFMRQAQEADNSESPDGIEFRGVEQSS